jgi:4-amino-4-deoxy-L-arabinose transferase-like glycosyltransferase
MTPFDRVSEAVPPKRSAFRSPAARVGWFCIAIFLLLALASAWTRRPWCDEAWFADPAYNLLTKGMMGTTVLEPAGHYRHPIGIQQHTYWIMPLHILAQTAWYEVTGFSLESMRILSILFGLLGLAAWFQIIKLLTGDQVAAWVVVCFLSLDYTFIETASVGRMDMMSAALGFSALAMFLRMREQHFTKAVFISQALVAASLFTHPVGGMLSFAALGVVTVHLDRKRIRLVHVGLAMVPYLAGMAGWGIYILQKPDDFVAQFRSNASGRFQDLARPWIAIQREIAERYLQYFGFQPGASVLSRLKIVPVIAYLAGCIGALASRNFRSRPGMRTLFLVIGTYVIGLVIIDSSRQGYYLVYSLTSLCVGFAMWMYWLWIGRAVPRSVLGAAVCMVLLLQGALTAYRIVVLNTMQKRYMPVIAFLQREMPPEKLLMGSAELGFKLGFDRNLTDDVTLGYYTKKRADFIVVEDLNYGQSFESFRARQPEVYRYVTQMLSSDYRCVYDHNVYKIYRRR